MSTPIWKIYDSQGKYVAACTYSEDAAAVVSLHGDGATIRHGHSPIVWRNGSEDFDAGESYDRTAALIMDRWSVYQHRKIAERRAAQDAFEASR